MEFTETALILSSDPFRESDRLVRLLTPGHGLISAFAFGGARSRRRFLGCLEPLTLVRFKIAEARRTDSLNLREGALLDALPGLRADPRRMNLALQVTRFVEAVLPKGRGKAAFPLAVSALRVLAEHDPPPEVVPLFFRARLAFEEGYRPEIAACHACGRPLADIDGPSFLVDKGRVSCGACLSPDDRPFKASPGALLSLDWVGRTDPTEWPRLNLAPELRRQCFELVERYVAFHLGLRWSRGSFRKV